jgi:hypothetical protein
MPRLIGAAQAVQQQAEQITTFNSTGTLTTQPLTSQVQYVIVAGGGAGGGGIGGGGGAGGYRHQFQANLQVEELVQNL